MVPPIASRAAPSARCPMTSSLSGATSTTTRPAFKKAARFPPSSRPSSRQSKAGVIAAARMWGVHAAVILDPLRYRGKRTPSTHGPTWTRVVPNERPTSRGSFTPLRVFFTPLREGDGSCDALDGSPYRRPTGREGGPRGSRRSRGLNETNERRTKGFHRDPVQGRTPERDRTRRAHGPRRQTGQERHRRTAARSRTRTRTSHSRSRTTNGEPRGDVQS